ncbi:hypothetical protein GJ496_008136 [Pomphorhynchus laevis]|nr:hypothetical protein GJ496_008136 [Pomphorhynchus laevis]
MQMDFNDLRDWLFQPVNYLHLVLKSFLPVTLPSRNTLKCFRINDKNIVIRKKADKCKEAIVCDTNDYITEATRQLSSDSYKNCIQTLDLNDTVKTKLTLTAATTDGAFYISPKTHKAITPCLGRPIISTVNTLTEQLSKYLLELLKPDLLTVRSYLPDVDSLIRLTEKWRTCSDKNCLLVTLDVESLCTFIPLDDGIHAVAKFLKTNCDYDDNIADSIK